MNDEYVVGFSFCQMPLLELTSIRWLSRNDIENEVGRGGGR